MNKLQRDYPVKYEEFIERVSAHMGLEVEEMKAAKNLRNDLMFDSLDEVETIMEAESVFEVAIPDEIAGALNGDTEAISNAVWDMLNEKE